MRIKYIEHFCFIYHVIAFNFNYNYQLFDSIMNIDKLIVSLIKYFFSFQLKILNILDISTYSRFLNNITFVLFKFFKIKDNNTIYSKGYIVNLIIIEL